MITTLFGALWIGLSASASFRVTPLRAAVFSFVTAALLAASGILIWKGRALRKRLPTSAGDTTSGAAKKQFKIVSIAEGVAIGISIWIANVIHRPDLSPIWIAMIVGIHFVPLARIFSSPVYYGTGVAITLWAGLSWILFASPASAVSAGIGCGIILWITSLCALIRQFPLAIT